MTRTPTAASSTVFGVDFSKLLDQLWGFRRRISKRFLLLEFGLTSLTLVEAKQGDHELQFEHFRRIELPPEAIERGVPADPGLMAALIRDLCKEEKIPAHRVAVVLPPEAAFTMVVHLPDDLSEEQAAAYASDPASGLQIPIPLQQTDFNLIPLNWAAAPAAPTPGLRPYFLASVPQKLVEQLLATLSAAQLELHRLEFGFTSQMRLSASEVLSLEPGQVVLQLELLPDCSHATVITAAGPLRCERLAAMREFPEPSLSVEHAEAALSEGIGAEAVILKDDRYLPISELDLRVLCLELTQLMQSTQEWLGTRPCQWVGVKLCGINSAHPGIADLLAAELQLPVLLLRPLGAERVGTVVLKPLLVQQSLGRLVGLGLGLLPPLDGATCAISDERATPPAAQILAMDPVELVATVAEPEEQIPIAEPVSESAQPAASQAADSGFSLGYLWNDVELLSGDAEPVPELAPAPRLAPQIEAEQPEFDINEPSTWPSIKLDGPEAE